MKSNDNGGGDSEGHESDRDDGEDVDAREGGGRVRGDSDSGSEGQW